ncbi:MAG: KEOPS complex subunit Pcc1 [Euryarchaeota archaeon]|nr:KEOPS complex subunit Pcc1 [Euryarchaeota archaeon]
MKHEATFRFESESAYFLYDAVKPELEGVSGRSVADVWPEGDRILVIRVCAEDVSALRAALNTWLRLINIAKEMQEIA